MLNTCLLDILGQSHSPFESLYIERGRQYNCTIWTEDVAVVEGLFVGKGGNASCTTAPERGCGGLQQGSPSWPEAFGRECPVSYPLKWSRRGFRLLLYKQIELARHQKEPQPDYIICRVLQLFAGIQERRLHVCCKGLENRLVAMDPFGVMILSTLCWLSSAMSASDCYA